ncbi:MAG: protein kinase [Muribaculaceae bacterium]|nr:protein kinase [Muribaculaceae bacterium]
MTQFEQFSEVRCHSRYNRLIKAWRDGQWWMLKGLKSEYENDPVMKELLRKEFDLCMLLRHTGVVGCTSIEFVPELGGTFIVQELVEGCTLTKWLEAKHSNQDKVDVLIQLSDVLAYCHSMGVVHRDVKPSNVMITPLSKLILIDFGLAVAANQQVFRLPAGTKQYMAPEQLRDDVTVDGRADLFAVGRIMQQMKLPYRYKKVTNCLLQENREHRYHSALQLSQALQNVDMRHRLHLDMALVAVLVGVVTLLAYKLGNGVLGNRLLGVGDQASPVMPALLTQDTTNHWVADTTHYITYTDTLKGFSFSYPKITSDIPGPINEQIAIDLGLNVLWAPFNVGCDHASLLMPGGYYGYGEPSGRLITITPDNVPQFWNTAHGDYAGTEHDIVRVHWGGKWRTPRQADFDELLHRCQWTLIHPDHLVPGYLVTGPNGNSIYLPLAGFRYETRYYVQGEYGYYWFTSDACPDNTFEAGIGLWLKPEGIQYFITIANNGFSVRPVLDK